MTVPPVHNTACAPPLPPSGSDCVCRATPPPFPPICSIASNPHYLPSLPKSSPHPLLPLALPLAQLLSLRNPFVAFLPAPRPPSTSSTVRRTCRDITALFISRTTMLTEVSLWVYPRTRGLSGGRGERRRGKTGSAERGRGERPASTLSFPLLAPPLNFVFFLRAP